MSELSFLKSWMQSHGSPAAKARHEMARALESFFSFVFNVSPDGISILDPDFTILGVNTTMDRWYAHAGAVTGRNCFEVFHRRGGPCKNCPATTCRETGRPQTGLVPYEAADAASGTQELSVFPLYDDSGKLLCIVEYVRPVTSLNRKEQTIEALKKRVQLQDAALHEQEMALEVLVRRGHRAERAALADVLANIAASVTPVIFRLKERLAGSELAADVELLESMMDRVTSPLLRRLAMHAGDLTPREREIASLVAEGRTSKDIADRLCLTVKAVDFHRGNLRRKLRMDGSTKSLQERLLELSEQ